MKELKAKRQCSKTYRFCVVFFVCSILLGTFFFEFRRPKILFFLFALAVLILFIGYHRIHNNHINTMKKICLNRHHTIASFQNGKKPFFFFFLAFGSSSFFWILFMSTIIDADQIWYRKVNTEQTHTHSDFLKRWTIKKFVCIVVFG